MLFISFQIQFFLIISFLLVGDNATLTTTLFSYREIQLACKLTITHVFDTATGANETHNLSSLQHRGEEMLFIVTSGNKTNKTKARFIFNKTQSLKPSVHHSLHRKSANLQVCCIVSVVRVFQYQRSDCVKGEGCTTDSFVVCANKHLQYFIEVNNLFCCGKRLAPFQHGLNVLGCSRLS